MPGELLASHLRSTEFKAGRKRYSLVYRYGFSKVELWGTVTELPGNGKRALLLASDISVPPEGAAPLNVEDRLEGVQKSRETETTCARAASEKRKKMVEICALLCADCLRMARVLYQLTENEKSLNIPH